MVSQSHSSGTFILVELMKTQPNTSHWIRDPIWNVWFLDTPYRWITLHPKCHRIRKPYLTNCHIFSFFQVVKLSVLDFQRCESSVIMITQICYSWIKRQAPLKRKRYSQQHNTPLSQNETVRYSCPKGESYAAILCVRLTYPWRRTRLCINTLLNWIY